MNLIGFNFNQGTYEIPNSYTAEVVEEEIPCPDGVEGCEVYHTRKVAVLIPLKQEPEKPKEYVSFGSIPKGELKIFVAKYPEYHFERWVEGDSVFYSNGHTTSEHALADDPVYGDGYVILDRDTQKLYIFKDGKLVESGEPGNEAKKGEGKRFLKTPLELGAMNTDELITYIDKLHSTLKDYQIAMDFVTKRNLKID